MMCLLWEGKFSFGKESKQNNLSFSVAFSEYCYSNARNVEWEPVPSAKYIWICITQVRHQWGRIDVSVVCLCIGWRNEHNEANGIYVMLWFPSSHFACTFIILFYNQIRKYVRKLFCSFKSCSVYHNIF